MAGWCSVYVDGIDWVRGDDPKHVTVSTSKMVNALNDVQKPVDCSKADFIMEVWELLKQTMRHAECLHMEHLTWVFKSIPRDVDINRCNIYIENGKLYLVDKTRVWLWFKKASRWNWLPQQDRDSDVPATKKHGLIEEMNKVIHQAATSYGDIHVTWMFQKLPLRVNLFKVAISYDPDRKVPILTCDNKQWIWCRAKCGAEFSLWTPI